MNPTYDQWYQPEHDLSLDESTVKFKGRLFFRQYLPAKPTRWGIKQFVLMEAKSGYCLKSAVYSGKTSFLRVQGVSPNGLFHLYFTAMRTRATLGKFLFHSNSIQKVRGTQHWCLWDCES